MSNPVSIEFSNTWPPVILEVNFDEGGNQSARRKPSKSG